MTNKKKIKLKQHKKAWTHDMPHNRDMWVVSWPMYNKWIQENRKAAKSKNRAYREGLSRRKENKHWNDYKMYDRQHWVTRYIWETQYAGRPYSWENKPIDDVLNRKFF